MAKLVATSMKAVGQVDFFATYPQDKQRFFVISSAAHFLFESFYLVCQLL